MSRDISKLRDDVEANCRLLIEICKRRGYNVLVTCTTRTEAEQIAAYKSGKSNTPKLAWHGCGLAFDVCQNIKGKEYNDQGFWDCVSSVGEAMGFEWGGRWKSIVDKPHFQWSQKMRLTTADIYNGKRPTQMPLYEMEVEDMTQAELKQLIRTTIAEVEKERESLPPSAWSKADREWAEVNKIIVGDGKNMRYKCPVSREEMVSLLHRLKNII